MGVSVRSTSISPLPWDQPMGFQESKAMEGPVELAGSVSVAQHWKTGTNSPSFPDCGTKHERESSWALPKWSTASPSLETWRFWSCTPRFAGLPSQPEDPNAKSRPAFTACPSLSFLNAVWWKQKGNFHGSTLRWFTAHSELVGYSSDLFLSAITSFLGRLIFN